MNITSVSNLIAPNQAGLSLASAAKESPNTSFDNIFEAAKNLVNETNSYSNAAEDAETSYALGLTDSTTDLQVAQQKATLALQYTVAVRNNIMDAYKEIMNLQF